MKPFIFLIALTAWGIQLTGQEVAGQHDNHHYQRGKIILSNTLSYKIKDITITQDSVIYKRLVANQRLSYPHYYIESLKVQEGNKMLGGAAIGAGVIFIFTLEALLDNQENPKNWGWIYSGALVGGAVLGGLIGMTIPVWKTWDFEKQQVISLNVGVHSVREKKFPATGIRLRF